MVTTSTNSLESPPSSNTWGRAFWHPLPVGMLVAVLVSLAIDLPVAEYARTGKQPRWVSELLENAEPFGHGIGTTLIVIAVLALDPVRRRSPLPLLAGSLGAGMVANLAKLLVIRIRPREIEVLPETVWLTFGGMWSISGGNGSQSFPSAHTATAVGLAVMLSDYYPRGRWFFTMMAVLVGMQRIQCSAHFPSDVFAGAIVGWIVAVATLQLASRNSR
ncbi:MAG: phosphatase PAP2 family protein [Planctomycetaceae bacterium]